MSNFSFNPINISLNEASHDIEQLREHREEILHLAQQDHSANVRVFGSVARGEATEGSDVDFHS
jgi:predicted nucleotidyltransferase